MLRSDKVPNQVGCIGWIDGSCGGWSGYAVCGRYRQGVQAASSVGGVLSPCILVRREPHYRIVDDW